MSSRLTVKFITQKKPPALDSFPFYFLILVIQLYAHPFPILAPWWKSAFRVAKPQLTASQVNVSYPEQSRKIDGKRKIW